MVATLTERRSSFHQSIVGANQTATTPRLRDHIATLAEYLRIHGFSQADAINAAQQRVYQELLQQTRLLAFLDCFRILGIATLAVAPLVLLTKYFVAGRKIPTEH